MTIGKRLCLNMIVKNEMANLQRCLGAVAGHIDCWVIGDTGSTDGTQDFIKAFFADRNLPGELHEFPFLNFEQARNAALDQAYASPLAYDYLLFADADMELVVEDAGFRAQLEGPGYRLLQRADSGLIYWNTRLVRRDAGARYHGVTHEYLDVPGEVHGLPNIWYKDHASGSNRVDKFERDIKLLLAALEKDPENHRYWFYLAQSYRDAGRTAEAAVAYAKRAQMGGWDEEAWNARLQEARCLQKLGDDAGFIRQALAAFNQRPQRAEPLYDLARFYRENGMNEVSVLFSEAGLAIKRPEQDILFLEDFIYTTGLQEEFAIAANYSPDPVRKDRGFAVCNWLALNRTVTDEHRQLARSNLFFYAQSANTMMPSFSARPIGFTPPEGYRPSAPSVSRLGDQIVLVQPTVGNPVIEDAQLNTPSKMQIRTRNFLVHLSDDLGVQSTAEILPSVDVPEATGSAALGIEAIRLFAWRDQLWTIACARASEADGWCPVMARVDDRGPGPYQMTDRRVLSCLASEFHGRSWMPLVKPAGINTAVEQLQFFSAGDPLRIVDGQGQTLSENAPAVSADQFKDGTQAIAFQGGWLALVHEVRPWPNEARLYTHHRFVWLDDASRLAKIGRPFFFNEKGVEFAAGLTWHPNGERLLISYGVADRESWIAVVDASEVGSLLEAADLWSNEACWNSPATKSSAGANSRTVESQRKELAMSTQSGRRDDGNANRATGDLSKEASGGVSSAAKGTEAVLLELAPFLRLVDSPQERSAQSRAFDSRIAPLLSKGDFSLPQIHCFYEVLSDTAEHRTLIAATTSMRAAGHPVRVWSYSPNKLEFLLPLGVEVRDADDVMPRTLFEQIVAGSEIRYFSDVFRYAVLYEHGGLWMDCDVVMLRPFPFHGEYFFNLQWRGGHQGHFICGNVIYAEAYSHHLRALYEMSIERFHGEGGKGFGEIGPRLLSDYIASDSGAELREWVFGPMLFNSIDWTEMSAFDKPLPELADYLNDERVFGIHLWTARNAARSNDEGAPLISLLIDPLHSFPTLTSLADRFNTDKNRHTGNRHAYARVYDRLLSSRRLSMRRLMEIGLCRISAEGSQTETPSVSLWQTYFPYTQVIGVDLADFSQLNNQRFESFVCDQSRLDDLRSVAAKLEPGSLDVIIDDGSHASFDEQLTLREFFPLLVEGGWYFIEDLDWQPPGEDADKITLTKNLMRELQQGGSARSPDPLGISALADQFAEILFFDSHFELSRARLLGGLVAIRKRGGVGLVR
ncbi:glycosyltransferase [Mesorhizobium sp. M0276]|uniref:glycosyltransferase n=1 Tax=Mesorhizobium sp. M0276 TaxID=2956928 RepID=UPI00333831EB